MTLFLAALCAAQFVATGQPAEANSDGWSKPRLVFEGQGWTVFNTLVATPYGTVHAFWQSNPSILDEDSHGEQGADNIWYAQMQPITSDPAVNILAAPGSGGMYRSIHAVAESDGRVNLFGMSDPQCLEHSIARFDLLGSPAEWMRNRTCLGETEYRFGAVLDGLGQLHVAFSTLAGQVQYTRYSPETGRWSPAASVTESRGTRWAVNDAIAVGPSGRIHIVWSEFEAPRFYPPLGVYYSHSSDGGVTWSPPLELAGDGHTEPAIAAVGSDAVHVVWNGSAVVKDRFHRFSRDGGRTWSPVHRFAIDGGILGPPALTVDTANGVHTVLSADNGLFYAHWTEQNGWTDPQQMFRVVQAGDPSAVVTGGNRLNVLFREGTRRIWYMDRVLDAPSVAARAIPTPSRARRDSASTRPASAVSTAVSVSATPDPPPSARLDAKERLAPGAESLPWATPILIGPSVALLLLLLLGGAIRKRT